MRTIGLNPRTNQATMTNRSYMDNILTTVEHFILSCCPAAMYQQDNARLHIPRLSQRYLQGYDVFLHPARLPDLQPIEHVWDLIRR